MFPYFRFLKKDPVAPRNRKEREKDELEKEEEEKEKERIKKKWEVPEKVYYEPKHKFVSFIFFRHKIKSSNISYNSN